MDKIKDLTLNALKYYDTNNEKYSKFFDKVKYYRMLLAAESNELDHNVIIFYDKDKIEFFRSRFEMLGHYNGTIKMWAWGWTISDKKNEIIMAKKLLNYALDLGKEFSFLKSELVTSRFRISSEIQLDIHASIASYISKNPLIFKLLSPDISMTYLTDDQSVEIYELRHRPDNNSNINYLYLLDEYKFPNTDQ